MPSTTLLALQQAAATIHQNLAKIVVGHGEVVDQLLVALLAGQHCLLESHPGSAKNVLVAALAKLLGLSFYRVHCTADLSAIALVSRAALAARTDPNRADPFGDQPSEATEDSPGLPHVMLIDDVSRLVPSARVVIQQAMQEGVVHLEGQRFVTPTPFIVFATKYRQDEEPADVAEEPRDDRYMLKIAVRFPNYHDEFQLVEADAAATRLLSDVEPVLDVHQLFQFQEAARAVVMPVHVVHYALRLVRSTRLHEGQTPDFTYEWIGTGAGPRASHHLLTAAKMRAAWDGRDFAGIEDVQAMTHCVLRHRLVANQNARANGITPDRIIDRLVYEIPVRVDGDDVPAAVGDAPKFDFTSDDQWMGE